MKIMDIDYDLIEAKDTNLATFLKGWMPGIILHDIDSKLIDRKIVAYADFEEPEVSFEEEFLDFLEDMEEGV